MTAATKRWIVVAIAGLLVTALTAGAPHALRRFDGFRVREIEVRGTRYLEPAHAAAAAGITGTATVFDDFEPWRVALLKHPLVAAATVGRRLPHTIVLEITEAEPIALVRTPELRAVSVAGRVLPIPSASPGLDLPVVSPAVTLDSSGRVLEAAATEVITTLARLRAARPSLVDWVSEARVLPPADVRLVLRWPAGAEILIPTHPDEARLEELDLVLSDLAAARDGARADTATATELARVRRIDARFRDQIVVSLAGGAPPRTPRREDR